MSEQIDLTDYSDSASEEGTEWVEKRLGEVFDSIYSGGTPKKGKDEYYGGNIPFVKIEDLNKQQGDGVTTAKDYITEQALEDTSTRAFDPGTLLLTIYGSLAETAIVQNRVATNQGILGLWNANEDNVLYVRYAIDNTQPKLASLSRQTTQANLGKGIVKKHKIPIPPLPEQRKIATVLYTVDRAIEKSEEITQNLNKLQKGTLRQLFENGTAQDTPTKETPMGKFPKHWELKQLQEVGTLINGSAFPKAQQGMTKGKFPFVKVSDTNDYRRYVTGAKNYISQEQADEIGCNIHPKGTVILPKRGAAIMTNKRRILAQESAIDNNQIGIVGDEVQPLFLYYYLSDVDMGRFVQEGAVKSLTKSLLSKIRVPVPPSDTQTQIVEILESIDNRIGIEQEIKTKYQRLKEGLQQDLLSGTVRTTDTNIEVPDEIAQYG